RTTVVEKPAPVNSTNGEARLLAAQHADDVLDSPRAHVRVRDVGVRTDVRGGDEVGRAQQRIVGRRGLRGEGIERGEGQMTAVQGLGESRLVDETGAGGVDQTGT